MAEEKKLICEGNCKEDYGWHSGTVVSVIVSEGGLKKPVKFNYCELAINTDRSRGFLVTEEPIPSSYIHEAEADVLGKEAGELVEKFRGIIQPIVSGHAYNNIYGYAKRCAIIHCDLMIEEMERTDETRLRRNHYQQLRQYIQSLK